MLLTASLPIAQADKQHIARMLSECRSFKLMNELLVSGREMVYQALTSSVDRVFLSTLLAVPGHSIGLPRVIHMPNIIYKRSKPSFTTFWPFRRGNKKMTVVACLSVGLGISCLVSTKLLQCS